MTKGEVLYMLECRGMNVTHADINALKKRIKDLEKEMGEVEYELHELKEHR